jgi:hypothetical protein
MRTVVYRRWNPDRSPIQIEFPAELLRDLRILREKDSSGALYGTRQGQDVRLLAAHPRPGLQKSGIFFYRLRGEVFLTETEMIRFEESKTDIALVMAGRRGGFFLRQEDGSLQGVSSHEEFLLDDVWPQFDRPAEMKKPRFGLVWAAVLTSLLLAIPIGALAYLLPLHSEPLNLGVKERDGQLMVSWNPRANTAGGQLEIADGAAHVLSTVRLGQTGATWVIQDGDITVAIRSNPESGAGIVERVRFLAHIR